MVDRQAKHSLVAQHDEQVAEGAPNLQAPAEAVEAQRRGRGPAPLLALSGNHKPGACCHAPAAAGLRQTMHTPVNYARAALITWPTPSISAPGDVKHLQERRRSQLYAYTAERQARLMLGTQEAL